MNGKRGRREAVGAAWVMVLMLCAPAAEAAPDLLQGRLVYSRLSDGTWQIWQTDLGTGQRTQLTSSAGDKRYPSMTPDGRVTYCTNNQQCYVLDNEHGAVHPLLQELWPLRDVAWSPDETRVAFSKVRTDLVDSANLWVADPSGAARRMLTNQAGIQYNPNWSSDGQRLAYVGGHGYGTYEIYAMDAAGGEPRQLTNNSSHEFLPAWSPDGRRIAFASDASGNYDIWVMAADGSSPTQLTAAPGLDIRPAWSPDGRFIAFTTNRTGTLQIWVVRPDGTDQHVLEQADGGVCDPVWR